MGYDTFQACELLVNVVGQQFAMPALVKNYGGGFKSSVLVGKSHGLRKWQLRADLIADYDDLWLINSTEFGTVSGYEYLWKFFQRFWTNGAKPFYIRVNEITYLAGFIEPILDFQVFTSKLYSGELLLEQRKTENVWFSAEDASVFNPMLENVKPVIYLNADDLTGTTGSAVASWTDANGNVFTSDASGPTIQTKNSKKVVRFSGSSTPLDAGIAVLGKQIFVLASYDTIPFDADRGLLSGQTVTDCLVAVSGASTFFSLSIGNSYEYRANNTVYAENNQIIIGSNKLFLISIKYPTGFDFQNLRIGQQKNLARKWRGDVRKILIYNQILSDELFTKATNALLFEKDA